MMDTEFIGYYGMSVELLAYAVLQLLLLSGYEIIEFVGWQVLRFLMYVVYTAMPLLPVAFIPCQDWLLQFLRHPPGASLLMFGAIVGHRPAMLP
jgi:hypothetical protein